MNINPRTIPQVVTDYVAKHCGPNAVIRPIQHCRFMVSYGLVCMYIYTDMLRETITDVQVD